MNESPSEPEIRLELLESSGPDAARPIHGGGRFPSAQLVQKGHNLRSRARAYWSTNGGFKVHYCQNRHRLFAHRSKSNNARRIQGEDRPSEANPGSRAPARNSLLILLCQENRGRLSLPSCAFHLEVICIEFRLKKAEGR